MLQRITNTSSASNEFSSFAVMVECHPKKETTTHQNDHQITKNTNRNINQITNQTVNPTIGQITSQTTNQITTQNLSNPNAAAETYQAAHRAKLASADREQAAAQKQIAEASVKSPDTSSQET